MEIIIRVRISLFYLEFIISGPATFTRFLQCFLLEERVVSEEESKSGPAVCAFVSCTPPGVSDCNHLFTPGHSRAFCLAMKEGFHDFRIVLEYFCLVFLLTRSRKCQSFYASLRLAPSLLGYLKSHNIRTTFIHLKLAANRSYEQSSIRKAMRHSGTK